MKSLVAALLYLPIIVLAQIYPMDKVPESRANLHFFTENTGAKWYFDVRTFAIEPSQDGTLIGGAFTKNLDKTQFMIVVTAATACTRGGKVYLETPSGNATIDWRPSSSPTGTLSDSIVRILCHSYRSFIDQHQTPSTPKPQSPGSSKFNT